jgi:hypothetical protein
MTSFPIPGFPFPGFPVPGRTGSRLVVAPPTDGEQRWAGAPSAHPDGDGVLLAYRTRGGDGDRVVVARSADGERVEPVAELPARALGVPMVERAALARTGDAWRLYLSYAEEGTKAWYVGLLEAATVEGLGAAELRPLDLAGPLEAVKDPIVRRGPDGWRMWVCVHHLDVPGAEDRMSTAYATSADGLHWRRHGTVLSGRMGCWDARGARLTSVLPDGRACYDGRASAAENWFERTGLAAPVAGGPELAAVAGEPVADVRYLEVLPLPSGGHRIWYEARRPDGAHELRTELQP